MPYIKKGRAEALLEGFPVVPPDVNPGDLTYLLTESVVAYLEERGISYTTLNDCTGALENTKAELRERITNRYEQNKRRAPGSVDPYEGLTRLLAGHRRRPRIDFGGPPTVN